MNMKVKYKKMAGYFWVASAILWGLYILVIIYTSVNYIMIAIASLNILVDGLNGYLFLRGSNYLLITDDRVEIKHSFFKPKVINFENMKSLQIRKRISGKDICITTLGKPSYIYDLYQKPLVDIKQIIFDRIG